MSSASAATVAELRRPWYGIAGADFQLTRFLLLRGLGFIYLVGFLIIVRQWLPLLGEAGLMPVSAFLDRVAANVPAPSQAYWNVPSVFWWSSSDGFALVMGWLGLCAAGAVTLGFANAPMMALLWFVYGSFVHVGQSFYSYGWEILLLEAGFLAIFLAPPLRGGPRVTTVPPLPVIWLYRWLTFRLMFGAGLIKVRGDECWRDLTCLLHHYETQPNPHPLSWLLHQGPEWMHQGGVLFNHFVELVVPFFLFAPRRWRHWAGGLTIAFQGSIIVSGNLSFLNWLTIVIALSAFDDAALSKLIPRVIRDVVRVVGPRGLSRPGRFISVGLCALVGVLSLNPVANMLDPGQRMNAGFDPLNLVNSYGAFGSVGKVRQEVIIEGTRGDPDDPDAVWEQYEFPCKPGAVAARPCLVTPYHYRLAWQLWFAGFGGPRREPWLVHLVQQLLEAEPNVMSLVSHNPFAAEPPSYIRVRKFRYTFTRVGESGWWHRELVGDYLPALSLDDPRLERFLERRGWE